jgi:hypothetical protein
MMRKPESKSFLAKRASKKETQPKSWVFLLRIYTAPGSRHPDRAVEESELF